MGIIERLRLQQKLGCLVLFREGVFLRAYNESCYILTQLLNHNLKVNYCRIHRVNQSVLISAFPANKLGERLPQAELTAFGATLTGDFDLSAYSDWFKRHCPPANEVCAAAAVREKDVLASGTRATAQNPISNLPAPNIFLSPQQLSYLKNWQKGAYPVEVDLGFIESLKVNLSKY